jgi:tetratricopeptide (TPR) repeat protein
MRSVRAPFTAVLLTASLLAAQGPPDVDPAELLAEANRRFERGDFRGAAQVLEVILLSDPDEFDILFRLARAYHETGEAERFHAILRRMLAIDPGRAEIYLLLGRRLQKEGNFRDAEAAYRRALDLSADSVEALAGLAEVCLALGFHDEGIGYLRQIVERYPDNVPFLWLLARSLDDPAEEAALYGRILQASPRDDELARGRLNLLEARKDRPFFQVSALGKPQSVRLFFTPGTTSKAQFVDREEFPQGGGAYKRRATPNTPYIRVRINGAGPYRFLVDTGTQGIHVSSSVAKRLGLESFGTSRFEGLGLASTLYGEIVFLDSLRMDEVEIRNVPAETVDLVGIADGILNPAVLHGLRVQLLNSRRQLVLSGWPEPGEEDPLRLRADSRRSGPVAVPFLSFHGHMVMRVEIQGLAANALLDTGAESTILDLGLVERLPVLQAFDIAGYGVALEGITGEVLEAKVVREAQLVIAGKNLRITNLFAADLRRLANFYGPEIHAIIGMKHLRQFDMTFDFRDNQVFFQRILR